MSGEEPSRPPDEREAPRTGEHAEERPRLTFVEVRMFGALTLFFVAAGVVYYLWSKEWAGTVLFVLSSGLAAITGGYLFLQARLEAQLGDDGDDGDGSGDGEERDEHEGLPSVGASAAGDEEYLPTSSPWPLELGTGMTLAFIGLVLGRWVFLAGAAFCAHALYGWIDQSRRRV